MKLNQILLFLFIAALVQAAPAALVDAFNVVLGFAQRESQGLDGDFEFAKL